MLSRLSDEPVVKRPAIGLAVSPCLGVELANRLPDLVQGNVRRQRHSNRNRHRIRDLLGYPPVAGRREDAVTQPIKVHRDDRRRAPLDDPLEPTLKRRHHAGPRELALGKQTDELTGVEGFTRLSKRVQDHLRTAAGGDRDRPHRPEDPAGDRPIEVFGVNHEADRSIRTGDHEKTVGERHMIRNEQGTPLAGDIRSADDPHAIKRMRQPDQDEPQEGIRHERERPQEPAAKHDRRRQERASTRDASAG